MPEFQAWPKIPRLYGEVIVTEKIDGTNAAIGIEDDGTVYAQSRKQIIAPQADNHGFATWVYENADELREKLGFGLHFGEWCGKGIQRGYGLEGKMFVLFDAKRWRSAPLPDTVSVVPVLYEGVFSEHEVHLALHELRENGSRFSQGFKPAEGIIVYHVQGNLRFKVTLEGDEHA